MGKCHSITLEKAATSQTMEVIKYFCYVCLFFRLQDILAIVNEVYKDADIVKTGVAKKVQHLLKSHLKQLFPYEGTQIAFP